VTTDEIRAETISKQLPVFEFTVSFFLREIAAQLAEQTAIMREDLELAKRDELLTRSTAGIEAWRETLDKPPVMLPVRIPGPNDQVQHVACLALGPDGKFFFTTDAGMVTLEDADAQRIIALLRPPAAEGRPQ
jgi:hypothetical protein